MVSESVNPRGGGIYVHVDFPGAQTLQFKRPVVRRAFAKIGKEIQKTSRDRVSSHRGSQPGQDPGWESGKMYKSIGFYVPRATGNRPGFMVAISPNQKRGRGMTPLQIKEGPQSSGFYPAYLQFGVRRGAKAQIKKGKGGKDVRVKKKGAAGGSGWRMAPRANFMTEALRDRKYWAERTLFNALKRAVIPEAIS